jgi:hypothetical protein
MRQIRCEVTYVAYPAQRRKEEKESSQPSASERNPLRITYPDTRAEHTAKKATERQDAPRYPPAGGIHLSALLRRADRLPIAKLRCAENRERKRRCSVTDHEQYHQETGLG